ncbi:hypothetical protein NQ317_014209 [Molorchus minor]|uniref:Uncharacterized protein n=1 Tax=Molorchus minor TaxID=1323400 RepID=A0ABQ9JF46_9CUCU|nr:hypothetical protein NQ317_014209 [Molorchus minor]
MSLINDINNLEAKSNGENTSGRGIVENYLKNNLDILSCITNDNIYLWNRELVSLLKFTYHKLHLLTLNIQVDIYWKLQVAAEPVRRYVERPNRFHPTPRRFVYVIQRARDTVQIQEHRGQHAGRARRLHMLQTKEEVLDIVEDDPSTSTKKLHVSYLIKSLFEKMSNNHSIPYVQPLHGSKLRYRCLYGAHVLLFVVAVVALTASVVLIAYWIGLPYWWNRNSYMCVILIIIGHWLLMNICFHYYMAVVIPAGYPPQKV